MDSSRQEPQDPLTLPFRRGNPSQPAGQGADHGAAAPAPPGEADSSDENSVTNTISLRPGQSLAASQVAEDTPGPQKTAVPAHSSEDIPEVRTIFLGPKQKKIDPAELPVAQLMSEEEKATMTVLRRRPAAASVAAPEPAKDGHQGPKITPPTPPPRHAAGPHEPVAPPAPTEEAAAETTCPRCQSKLINPGNLGWCPKCGYCQLLEADRARERVPAVVAPKRKVSALGLMEFLDLMSRIPVWLFILVGGLAVAVGFSMFGHLMLRPETPARTIWAIAQFLVGLIALFTAQIWALALIAPHEERISPKDLFWLSGRLWGVAYQRLPATRWPIWLGCWGIALLALDVILIGGLSQEFKLAALSFQDKIEAVRPGGEGGGNLLTTSPDSAPTGTKVMGTVADLGLTPLAGVPGWVAASLPWFSPARPPPGG